MGKSAGLIKLISKNSNRMKDSRWYKSKWQNTFSSKPDNSTGITLKAFPGPWKWKKIHMYCVMNFGVNANRFTL